MNIDILKTIIYEQHEVIKDAEIVERQYHLEKNGNYVLVGLRRVGKSTMLYKKTQELVSEGVGWDQIVYINFEDERLSEFSVNDFNDILLAAAEISDKKSYFFFDEIQIIDGWEKFARRLADSKERVFITGSNAKMLSSDIATTLGGRYLVQKIEPYSWDEYLTAVKQAHSQKDLFVTKTIGKIKKYWNDYIEYGGLPECILYNNKRDYLSSVYQKVLLGDIVSRNSIRNDAAMNLLIKKIAETVRNDVSYTKLYSSLNSIGIKISKDSVISYVEYAKSAYLIFTVENYFSKFSERESNPKYYFTDNGILNLFLYDKSSILLENVVAEYLHRKYGDELYFLKSSKTGVDVDFFVPAEKTVYQVAYSLDGDAYDREIDGIVKLSGRFDEAERFVVLTNDEERIIEKNGVQIEIIPVYKYLID